MLAGVGSAGLEFWADRQQVTGRFPVDRSSGFDSEVKPLRSKHLAEGSGISRQHRFAARQDDMLQASCLYESQNLVESRLFAFGVP